MSDWHYLLLKLTPDPSLEPRLLGAAAVDLLSWRSLLGRALGDLHGIYGQARHYDILVKERRLPALRAVVRIQEADWPVFQTSLASFSCSLSEYLGSEYKVSACLRVEKHSPYLAAVADAGLVAAH